MLLTNYNVNTALFSNYKDLNILGNNPIQNI